MSLRKKNRNSSGKNYYRTLVYETLEVKRLLAADGEQPRLGMIPLPPTRHEHQAPLDKSSRGQDSGPGPEALSDTFKLHSRPSATKTIYLDFDGFTARGTSWNSSRGVASIVSPPYSKDSDPAFSNSELTDIQTIWQRVAGDYAPFDVNVTTEDPGEAALVNTGGTDNRWGIRAVFTTDDFPAPGSGGVAYINSFRWGYESVGATDTPCYIFNIYPPHASLAASHEVGHSLGLAHDGTNSSNPIQPNSGYYYGHGGNGETSWGPVMGAPYDRNVTQWDNGFYIGSNNGGSNANYGAGADDLAVITSTANGFGFAPDEQGGTSATAFQLPTTTVNSRQEVSFLSTIERASDQDFFRFSAGAGMLDLTIDPYVTKVFTRQQNGSFTTSNVSSLFDSANWPNTQSANLDVEATLYNASGAVIATSNPNGLRAEFRSLSLAGGTYFLRIDGVGFGNPQANPPTGYTDYGSIGQYLISGSFATILPQISVSSPVGPLSENDTGTQTVNFTVSLSAASGSVVRVNYATTVAGYSNPATSGNDFIPVSGTVEFAPGETSKSISVLVRGDRQIELNELFGMALNSPVNGLLNVGLADLVITDDDLWGQLQEVDFGTEVSPLKSGAAAVGALPFTASKGLGWTVGLSNLQVVDRGLGSAGLRDIALTSSSSFAFRVPNGTYIVRLTFGDAIKAHDQMRVTVEGSNKPTVNTGVNEFLTRIYTTTVTDGQLDLTFADMGGADPQVALAGIAFGRR